MKKFLFPVLLAAAFSGIWTDCKKADTPDNPLSADLGDTVEIAFQETVTFQPGDFQVTLDSVTGDSRCPLDVQCVWEGSVAANLRFTLNQNTVNETLIVMGTGEGRAPDSTVVSGYTIKLINVLPYPPTTDPIPQAEYRVKVVVTQ